MSMSAMGETIEEHGTPLDVDKKRVRCKYCFKEVGGFSRLQHHLGALGSDVTACSQVPDDVRVRMRGLLLEKKKGRLLKEVGRIEHPELPLKRNFVPAPWELRPCQRRLNNLTTPNKVSREIDASSEESDNGSICDVKPFQLPQAQLERGKGAPELDPAACINGSLHISPMVENSYFVKEEVKDDSVLLAERCIGKFFFEAGIDPTLVKLPAFQKMIDAVISCGTGYKAPSCDKLQGQIFQDEIKEVNRHVEDIKRSWARTGCSILLDGWTDKSGRSLMSFLVSAPQGTMFLRSVDVSDAIQDATALFLLFSKVIEEVGPQYVIQVVAHYSSDILEDAGMKVMEKYRSIFWTLCADHCINLILERIETMDHVRKVLNDAKTITKFIYSHVLSLELMKIYVKRVDMVKTSSLKSVASFMTLQNMVSERENLIAMFSSATWIVSDLASRAKGKSITKLVKDHSFWIAAADVLKITNPIIGILHQISGIDKASMGFLYDAMDRAKEAIKENLGGEMKGCEPIWTIIDDIWDNELHSPLHAAGYYLNPGLFYADDFYLDTEVSQGMMYCNVRMAKNQHEEEQIVIQLDKYRKRAGGLGKETAIDQRTTISPDLWWSLHGGELPEIQRFAIRILSQTCSGASRYMLNKGISEQLHADTRNCLEQQRLSDIEFVNKNLSLWRYQSSIRIESMFCHEDLDLLDDWVVES